MLLLAHLHLFGDVTKRRNLEHSSLAGNDKRKLTVRIGSHTGGGPLQGNARTDNRQTVRVHHSTCYGNAPLGLGGCAPEPQGETQDRSQSE